MTNGLRLSLSYFLAYTYRFARVFSLDFDFGRAYILTFITGVHWEVVHGSSLTRPVDRKYLMDGLGVRP